MRDSDKLRTATLDIDLEKSLDRPCQLGCLPGKFLASERLLDVPDLLIISVGRFRQRPDGTRVKLSNLILNSEIFQFDTRVLHWVADPILCHHDYDLVAFISHQGTLSGGHYKAFCKRGDSWFEHDDSREFRVYDIISKLNHRYYKDSEHLPTKPAKQVADRMDAPPSNKATTSMLAFTPYIYFYKRRF